MTLTLVLIFSLILVSIPHAFTSPIPVQIQIQPNSDPQDTTKFPAYPLQSPCARDCFVHTASCGNDILGYAIGCAPLVCKSVGWQATNDCYCRIDLQQSAYRHITNCIRDACASEAWNADEILNRARGIYGQYCSENGYTSVTTTAVTLSVREIGSATPTTKASEARSTSTPQKSTPWYKKLPTGAWIGIGIGICAVLTLLTALMKGHGGGGGGVGPGHGGQNGPPVVNLVNATNYLATHPR
jgi:hypothetical protein